MKKSLMLILLITAMSLASNAQVIYSGDFEDGTLGSWGSFSAPVAAVANPNTTGNPSAFCGSLDQSGGAWNGFRLWSDPPILSQACVKLKVDVYLASTGLIQLYMDNPLSSAAATYTKQATNIPALTWTTLEFDLTSLPAYDYKQIAFQSSITGVILFDNVKLLGVNGEPKPVTFDEKIITQETFGTKEYGTNNPTPSTSGGWGANAAWHWNWNDVTTFSTTNGYFESGSDSSIRIVSYNTGVKPAEWLNPSGGMHLLMTPPANYVGSWDTLYFKGIDIKNQIVSCVEFGWAKRGNMSPKDSINGFNVEISIDGESWIQLDTTLLQNPLAGDKWAYAHLPVNKLSGSKMEIRFACYMNQIELDDITVKGLEYVEAEITNETFGTKAYDTNNPTPQASGWGANAAWHWNWNDVTTFTTKNGYFESGSDSSFRICSYLNAVKPADWLNPSGGMHLLMAPTGYSGSWDTIYFKGIDIKDQIVSCLEFGWAKRANKSPIDTINGINVEISIDGGAWIQLDTTLLQNPLAGDKWAYAHLPILGISGNKMDIRFANYANQILIDDISVKGAVPAPKGVNDFAIEKIIFGTVDNAADYTGNLNMKWDADNVYLTFDIADDSIVNKGTAYQVDNIEVYFDMDNSKNIHWPRNGGYVANDATYDANDYQLRLVPDSAFSVNNKKFDADQVYTKTETGYQFKLTIAWDSLMAGFEPALGTQIGFDVLVSDNDAVASDPNRNQITLFTPSGMIYNDPSFMTTFQFEGMGTFSTISDIDAPSIVSNLVSAVTKNAVKLTWDNATDDVAINYYNIYQDDVLIKEKLYAVKTVNTYTAKALADGTYNFSIETVDNFGNISAKKASVSAIVSTVSVDNIAASKLAVYPNPVVSELNIKGVDQVSRVEVIGITGNVLKVQTSGSSINVADLSKGAYILKVYTAKEVLSTRFVKK